MHSPTRSVFARFSCALQSAGPRMRRALFLSGSMPIGHGTNGRRQKIGMRAYMRSTYDRQGRE